MRIAEGSQSLRLAAQSTLLYTSVNLPKSNSNSPSCHHPLLFHTPTILVHFLPNWV